MVKILTSALLAVILSFSVSGVSFAESTTPTIITTSIDSFTVGEAEQHTVDYLHNNGLDYPVGSNEYIQFLTSAVELQLADEIEQDLIRAYASIYLDNYDIYISTIDPNAEPVPYILSDSLKAQTIQEVRTYSNMANYLLDNSVKEQQSVSAVELSTSLSTSTYSFSGSKAQSYMNTYWNSINSSFGEMPNDCTNYASQIVWYAGLPMDGTTSSPGYHTTTTDWYNKTLPYNSRGWSTSWTVVGDFYSYWVGHRGHSYKVFTGHTGIASYVKPGDIIQIKNQSTGKWYHTVIVNYVSNGVVYYSGHTNNHLHKALTDISASSYDFRVIKFNY